MPELPDVVLYVEALDRLLGGDNECNYCPGCQTEGRILSDRSLARLLKDDWPKTLDDLES